MLNVLAGNADGHGKNLSLIFTASGLELAPFYDLVCTRVYPRLAPRLAMAVGGQHDIDNIGPVQWARQAEALGIAAPFLLQEVAALAHAIDAACDTARREVADRTHLPAIVLAVKKQARRCRTLLRRV